MCFGLRSIAIWHLRTFQSRKALEAVHGSVWAVHSLFQQAMAAESSVPVSGAPSALWDFRLGYCMRYTPYMMRAVPKLKRKLLHENAGFST